MSRREDYYCDEEIDLYELWMVLKRRKVALVLTVSFFLLLSALYAFLAKPVYRLEHHFAEPISETLPAQLGRGIAVLNSYLEEEDFGKASELLSLPKEKVESLVSVGFSNGKREKGVFSVTVDSYDPGLLKEFDRAVVAYMKSLPSVASVVELRRQEIKEQLKNYRSKLSDVSLIASRVKEELLSGRVKVIGFNPVELETALVNYQAKIASLERELQELAPFRDVAVAVSDEPVSPNVSLSLTVGLVSGLFVGLFVAFFLEWLEKVRKREKAS